MANNNNGSSPNQIQFGSQQDQGRRKNMEDRLRVENISTAGGLNLTVGMIADGIGGNVFGERAAELAIEVAFQELVQSDLADAKQLPILLQRTLNIANDVVFEEARRDRTKRGMGSTATVVAICQDHLYMANVGDSRAYLIRDDEVIQITQDHTWGQEMLNQDLITPDQLAKHPKAEELARSIGYDPDVTVDLGIYLNGEDDEQDAVENQGLLLGPNDRLLLCSDGLIKSRHDGEGNYVELREINQVVTQRAPQAAAEDLVSRAVKRKADDNVSVIVIEMPGSKRGFYLPPPVLYAAGAVLALLVVAALIFTLTRLGDDGEPVADNSDGEPSPTNVVVESDSADQGAILPTIETISTPVETIQVLTAGLGANLVSESGEKNPISEEDSLPLFEEGVALRIENGEETTVLILYDGSTLWVDNNTTVEFPAPPPTENAPLPIILREGRVVVQSNGPVKVSNPLESWAAVDQPQSLLGVSQDNEKFEFEGHCLGEKTCIVHGDQGQNELPGPGQMSRVGNSGLPNAPEPVNVVIFAFSPRVPAATATPEATETQTPTTTPTPTATVILPTRTPTPPPDRDGDGILDRVDQCPTEPGVPENGGCPIPPTEPPPPDDGGGNGGGNGGGGGDGGGGGGGGDGGGGNDDDDGFDPGG